MPKLSVLITELLDAREQLARIVYSTHPEACVAAEARLARAQEAIDAFAETIGAHPPPDERDLTPEEASSLLEALGWSRTKKRTVQLPPPESEIQ